MLHDEIIPLGRIAKTHGLDGTVSVVFQSDEVEIFDWELVFVEIHKKPTPFFIEEMNARAHDVLLKFYDYDDITLIEEFIGCPVFVPADYKNDEISDSYSQLIGFAVLDVTGASIGVIEDVLQYPMHSLLQVQHAGREVLIPANDDFITRIDHAARCIICSLPDGLLDLNVE